VMEITCYLINNTMDNVRRYCFAEAQLGISGIGTKKKKKKKKKIASSD